MDLIGGGKSAVQTGVAISYSFLSSELRCLLLGSMVGGLPLPLSAILSKDKVLFLECVCFAHFQVSKEHSQYRFIGCLVPRALSKFLLV